LAALGDKVLETALEREKGPWLAFEWQPRIEGMLATYYDWNLGPDTGSYGGRCPSCLRRILLQRSEETTSLKIERRPGSRA
jgi:hypothetical protein